MTARFPSLGLLATQVSAPSRGAHSASGPKENRLHPSIADRGYLHLAPLTTILADTISSRLVGTDLRVLDLGCGFKPYAPLFEHRCTSFVGVDVGPMSAADVFSAGEALPFRDRAFDVVLCTQVLEHDRHPNRTIQEAHRVLVPGGTLILSAPGVWVKHGKTDYWRWTDDGLREILHAFREVDVHSCGGEFSALFQILNLYIDPLPMGRRFLYFVNNILGLALDRALPAQNLIVNYVVVARK